MTMTGSQNRSAATTAPSSGLGLASAFIEVGHAALGGRVPLPKLVRRPSPLTRTSESKGYAQLKTSRVRLDQEFRDHRDTEAVAIFSARYRTIVNSRLQRTVHGQRQNCQACSPSATEKKMIWARPTRFSIGT